MNKATSYKTILPILLILVLSGCDDRNKAAEMSPDRLFKLDHLEHLQQRLEVNGETVRVVRIYADAPGYDWVADDDEGIACVDDAARAVRLYLRRYKRTGDKSLIEPAGEMLHFLLAMQAEDGEFYNFIWEDGILNTEHKNSRKSINWWTARGFRALAEGVATLKETDPELHDELLIAGRKTINRLREVFLNGESKPEIGNDAASVFALALVTWEEATADGETLDLLDYFIRQIIHGVAGPSGNFSYYLHKSWRNVWHSWGQLQVEALARAGQLLRHNELLGAAVAEAEGWHRNLLACKGMAYIEFDEKGDTLNTRKFPQLAYDMNCIVQGNIALYEITGKDDYAQTAGLAASWFSGNNAAGTPMYDPETGRGYDGILGPDSINLNSGAESTIEALLALEAIAAVPAAADIYYAKVHTSRHDDYTMYMAGENRVSLKRASNRWNIGVRQNSEQTEERTGQQ